MKTTQIREHRKFLFGLVLLVLLYIVIEAASFVAFRTKYKTSLPLRNPETGQLHQDIGIVPTLSDDARNKKKAGKKSKNSNAARQRSSRNGEVLHPFSRIRTRSRCLGEDLRIRIYAARRGHEPSSAHGR